MWQLYGFLLVLQHYVIKFVSENIKNKPYKITKETALKQSDENECPWKVDVFNIPSRSPPLQIVMFIMQNHSWSLWDVGLL